MFVRRQQTPHPTPKTSVACFANCQIIAQPAFSNRNQFAIFRQPQHGTLKAEGMLGRKGICMIGGHIILLVEDSDDDAFFFNRAVQKTGLRLNVQRVRNGQEAIDYLQGTGEFSDRDQYPLPHVIMLDLKMPICDGFDFLNWKRNQPSLACLPTIVMTSSRFDGDVRRSYELGAHSFTMKVNTTDSLSDRVNALRRWWFENAILIPPSENKTASQGLD